MAEDKLKVVDLPHRIVEIDETAPIKIQADLEELSYALAKTQKYLNDNLVGREDSSSKFEANAITHGPNEPTN